MFWSVAVVDNQQFANKESKVESSCSSLLVTHGIIGLARQGGGGIERGQRPHKETDGCYILFFNVRVNRIVQRYEKTDLSQLCSSYGI